MNRKWILRILAAGLTPVVCFAIWWLAAYDNYHAVIPGELYRSARMSAGTLSEHADSDRLASVLNLCPETNSVWHAREQSACSGRKIRHIDFPMAGNESPDQSKMDELVEIMRAAPKPMLIHCTHGADRTGLAVALYLSAVRKLPEAESRRALSIRFGHTSLFGMNCFDNAFSSFLRAQKP